MIFKFSDFWFCLETLKIYQIPLSRITVGRINFVHLTSGDAVPRPVSGGGPPSWPVCQLGIRQQQKQQQQQPPKQPRCSRRTLPRRLLASSVQLCLDPHAHPHPHSAPVASAGKRSSSPAAFIWTGGVQLPPVPGAAPVSAVLVPARKTTEGGVETQADPGLPGREQARSREVVGGRAVFTQRRGGHREHRWVSPSPEVWSLSKCWLVVRQNPDVSGPVKKNCRDCNIENTPATNRTFKVQLNPHKTGFDLCIHYHKTFLVHA